MRILILLIVTGTVAGCTVQRNSHSESSVLLKVGEQQVAPEEFKYIYSKNNFANENRNTEEDIREYLDLFINFKLKVQAGIDRGLDTTAAYRREYDQYIDQLQRPYLTENKYNDSLVYEAYARMQEEVLARHILVKVAPDALPSDTLAAYERITFIYNEVTSGQASFEKMAGMYSDDPSAKENQGNLGYFTAMQMVYPFENAAYTTPEGDFSPIFRTRYGYHFLEVLDKRNARGRVRIAHIMLRTPREMTREDSLNIRAEIDSLYRELSAGADWGKVVRLYSEDQRTKDKGGELGWINSTGGLPAFTEAAFGMDSINSISPPVRTAYGWHIIKLLEKASVPSFEEVEDQLRNAIQRSGRLSVNDKALFDRLVRENEFSVNHETMQIARSAADSTLLEGQWKSPGDPASRVLFNLKDTTIALASFYRFVEQNQHPVSGKSPAQYMNSMLDDFQSKILLDYEASKLPEKYFDYRMLEKEYREGIILFTIMEQEVWNKATRDSIGLELYFQQHQEEYKRRPTAYIARFQTPDATMRSKLLDWLEKGYWPGTKSDNSGDAPHQWIWGTSGLTPSQVTSRLAGLADSLGVSGEKIIQNKDFTGIFPASVSIADLMAFIANEEITLSTETIPLNAFDSLSLIPHAKDIWLVDEKPGEIVYFIEEREGGIPTLDEIRGKVISDYQDHLEKSWIADLRNTYSVWVNEEAFNNLLHELTAP